MKIFDFFQQKPLVLSFEIFPPKPNATFEPILNTITQLEDLKPDFISVTYGAAGTNSKSTVEIAQIIKDKGHTEPLAHLTCITNTPEQTNAIIEKMQEANIKNILALRGDYPADSTVAYRKTFAKDLIAQIKEQGDFCIAGAAYPEGHQQCPDKKLELLYLKEKIDAGADFLITQLFFENHILYEFLEKLDKLNIKIPVTPGIMPVFSKQQIEKICSLCGATIPKKIQIMIEKYGHDNKALQQAGLEYAYAQINDLIENKVCGIHLCIMNKPEMARAMVKNTKLNNR